MAPDTLAPRNASAELSSSRHWSHTAVKAVEGPAPNIQPVGHALQRYWPLTATGVTADLTFHYIDPIDIPPTATEANFHVYRHDAVFTDLGGVIDVNADTGTVTGITQFSDWTLAEPGATPGSFW